MPATGPRRYIHLFRNIGNPFAYIFDKYYDRGKTLHFVTKPNKLRFDVPSSLFQVFKEIFMEDVYNVGALVRVLPDNPVVIDIGANAGFFDVLLLSKIKNAQIYAYEPISGNVERMRGIAAANQTFARCVIIHSAAVTGKPSEMLRMYAQDMVDNQVVASSLQGFNSDNTKELWVPAVSLADILSKIAQTNVDLLKMDCEGSEYDIIGNTPPDLLRRIERMLIEVHDIDNQNNIQEFSEYLVRLGYTVKHAPINGFCHALEATRK
jgi:FkbM family methyltransferase